MEYISGARIDDVEQLETNRFDLKDVTTKLSDCFTTLMLKNGLIRSDAIAPSDILVRKCETTGATEIVLMAHGLYEEVTDKLRTEYAKLQTLRVNNINEVVTSMDRQVLRMQRTNDLIGDIQKAVYQTEGSFAALWIVTKSCVNFLYHDEIRRARTQWDRVRLSAAEKWTLVKLYASLFVMGFVNFSLLATVRTVSCQMGLA
jgi:ABC1 atypical kinase-like domain